MTPALLGFSTSKRGRMGAKRKLSKFDVEEIRRFVRAEGFGLPISEQVRQLANFQCATTTIKDVILNSSWHDPAYDRDVPIVVEALPPAVATVHAPWLIALLMAWHFCMPIGTSRATTHPY